MTATRRRFVHLLQGLLLLGVIGASLLVAAGAWAGDPPAAEEPLSIDAEIRIRVIHAKTGEKKFDSKLDDLQKYLTPYPYNSFKQVIDDKLQLGVSDTRSMGLLSGKNLTVTLAALTKEKATIRLLLMGQTGQMLDTTLNVGAHKLFFLAGPRYDNGVLFIAIEPHYDPEKVNVENVGMKRDDKK